MAEPVRCAPRKLHSTHMLSGARFCTCYISPLEGFIDVKQYSINQSMPYFMCYIPNMYENAKFYVKHIKFGMFMCFFQHDHLAALSEAYHQKAVVVFVKNSL